MPRLFLTFRRSGSPAGAGSAFPWIRKLGAFSRGRSGNVAVIFALSLLPMIGLVGLGVDYGMALSNKAKLDNAADTAAIAAVATAKAYIATYAGSQTDPTLTNNALAAGQNQAARTFTVNAGSLPFVTTVTPNIPLPSRSGQTFTATVSYTATEKNNFGKILGRSTTPILGRTAASADIPSYLDFYLLVDVSGSMGLPTTTAGAQQLTSKNNDMSGDYPYGCEFACHFPGYNGWKIAEANNIQLRSDAVNSAVCSLVQRAQQPVVANQYRIGVYPFINQMATLVGVTNNMTTVWNSVCTASQPTTLTSLLDTGATQLFTNNDPSTGTGSGGTHFEVVFPQMQSTISPYGNGSSQSQSKPFVFLVTDGMENKQHFYTWAYNKYTYPGSPSQFAGYGSANWDGSQSAPIDPTTCTALKNAGATISILYIPYNLIPTVQNGGNIAWENNKVNGFSPTLSTPLSQCASSGFFYTANTSADITNALNAMFNQAIQMAHLTR